MRIWNWHWVMAVAVPLLLLGLVPELRLPTQRLVTKKDCVFYALPLGWQADKVPIPSVLSRGIGSLDAEVWAIYNSDYPVRFNQFSPGSFDTGLQGRLPAYAALAKEHPHNAMLLTLALADVASSNGRVAGPWEAVPDWNLEDCYRHDFSSIVGGPVISSGISGVAAYSTMPNSGLSMEEIEMGLQIVHRGQALEPNNTYFDWMAAHFLYAQHRDEEATQTLIRASHKTGFDLHWRDLMSCAVNSTQQVYPLAPEEKTDLLMGSFRFGYHSVLRHVGYMALWSAMQKQESGDVSGALDIEGALARLDAIRLHRSFYGIDLLTGIGGVQSVWNAPAMMKWARALKADKALMRDLKSPQERALYASSAFEAFARAHGREDLALEAQKAAPEVVDLFRKRQDNQFFDNFLNRGSGGPMTRLYLSWWAATLAIWQILIASGLLVLSAMVGPVWPPRKEKIPLLSHRAAWYPLLLGGASSVVFYGLGSAVLVHAWRSGTDMDGGWNYGFGIDILTWAAVVAPLLLGALACLNTAEKWWRAAPRRAAPEPSLSPRELGASPAVAQFYEQFWAMQKLLWFKGFPVFIVLTALGYMWASAIHLPFAASRDVVFQTILGIAVPVYVLSLGVRWRFNLSGPRRAAIFAAGLAFRRAMAWCIALSLWFLLAAMALGIGPRRELGHQLTVFLNAENQWK